MATAQKPELVYFHGRGYGEIIRLTLTAAGIKYNEIDLTTREEYLALLPELLFGQVPLLRIDGQSIVQSGAIVRHIARKAKLLGTSELETTRIDMIYDGTRDFNAKVQQMHWVPEEKVREEVNQKTFPKYLPVFNKLLADSSSGFLVGDSLSLADLGLFEVLLAILDYWPEDALREYPHLLTFRDKLKTNERIVDYIENYRKLKTDDALVAVVRVVLSHTV